MTAGSQEAHDAGVKAEAPLQIHLLPAMGEAKVSKRHSCGGPLLLCKYDVRGNGNDNSELILLETHDKARRQWSYNCTINGQELVLHGMSGSLLELGQCPVQGCGCGLYFYGLHSHRCRVIVSLPDVSIAAMTQQIGQAS